MSDTAWAENLLERFVVPLSLGAELHVGAPLGLRGAERLGAAIAQGLDGTQLGEKLQLVRQTQLLALGRSLPPPRLMDDSSIALLLVALHDLLFLAHPDAGRLKPARLLAVARSAEHLCKEVRLCAAPATDKLDVLFARHTLFGRFFELSREDLHRPLPGGEKVYRGMSPPRRFLFARQPSAFASVRVAIVPELCAACEGAGARIIRALLEASPLTDLLFPVRDALAPWVPFSLLAQAPWLLGPAVARLVVQHYLGLGISTVGKVLAPELLAAVRRQIELPPAAGSASSLRSILTGLCLVSHLHLAAHVIALLPLPVRAIAQAPDAALGDFYGLFAALYLQRLDLALPRDVKSDPRLRPRVEEHVERCRMLATADRMRELATLLSQLPSENAFLAGDKLHVDAR